jgi:hypothetical protein
VVVTIGTVAINVGGHMTKANKDWDISGEKFYEQLKQGEEMENLYKKFMGNDNIEVKSERHIWEKSKNHFVEYLYRPVNQLKYEPSGISATKAEWWALFLIDDNDKPIMCYTIPVSALREIGRKYVNTDRDVDGGDGNRSKGVLVPIEEIALYPFNR